jgi:hypothetical protein
MKHLAMAVDGLQIFDGEVAEFTWTDNGQQVTVTGKYKSAPGLLEQLRGLNTKAEVIEQGTPGDHEGP